VVCSGHLGGWEIVGTCYSLLQACFELVVVTESEVVNGAPAVKLLPRGGGWGGVVETGTSGTGTPSAADGSVPAGGDTMVTQVSGGRWKSALRQVIRCAVARRKCNRAGSRGGSTAPPLPAGPAGLTIELKGWEEYRSQTPPDDAMENKQMGGQRLTRKQQTGASLLPVASPDRGARGDDEMVPRTKTVTALARRCHPVCLN